MQVGDCTPHFPEALSDGPWREAEPCTSEHTHAGTQPSGFPQRPSPEFQNISPSLSHLPGKRRREINTCCLSTWLSNQPASAPEATADYSKTPKPHFIIVKRTFPFNHPQIFLRQRKEIRLPREKSRRCIFTQKGTAQRAGAAGPSRCRDCSALDVAPGSIVGAVRSCSQG